MGSLVLRDLGEAGFRARKSLLPNPEEEPVGCIKLDDDADATSGGASVRQLRRA